MKASSVATILWIGVIVLAGTLGAQSPSVVTLNADKATVLNGKKIFPITFTPGPPNLAKTPLGDDALKELRGAGSLAFRIAQSANWDAALIASQHAALDWAQQQGMYCMVNLRERSAFAAGDAATEASLRSLVNEFKAHPALAFWKNKDEAWWGDTPAADLKRGYDVIKQEDPNHPVEQTHAPRGTLADLQPYNTAADVLAIDIYPVSVPPGKHSLLPNKEISMVGDWTKFLSDVSGGQNALWMVEQIAWSGVNPPSLLVFPTFRQSRYMAYQAIVNGARGLMFFGGNVPAALDAQDTPLGWNWSFWNTVLKRVVQEVGEFSPIAEALVAPNSALPATISGATSPDLEFIVREAPPNLYVIACKREGATANVTFSGLPTWASVGEVMFESPRTVTASGGQFTDQFAPFDVHVYRFAQTKKGASIIRAPQSISRYPGTRAQFNVFADGTGPLSYQWRHNGSPLVDGGDVAGVTTPTLTLNAVNAGDAGTYDVVVSGVGSVTSAGSALTVVNYDAGQVPSITVDPQSQSVTPGSSVSLRVETSGTGPFAFRWRKNGTPLSDGANISGATTWNLSISNASSFDAGAYDVVVTGATSVTSAVPSASQLLLYEPFQYPNVGGPVTVNDPAKWTFGGTGTNDFNVQAGSLASIALAAPQGNSAVAGGAGIAARRLFTPGVSSGAVYFSAVFRMNEIGATWNGAASQVGALTASDNASFRVQVMVQSSAPGYKIGVQKGGTGSTPTMGGSTFNEGETVFLVGKYDFTVSPNVASLWVNPDGASFGSASEPSTGALAATSGTEIAGLVIDRFNFRQNTATSVPAAVQWDELRVGTTWAEVTDPPPPVLTGIRKLPNGAFHFGYRSVAAKSYSVFASTNLLDWAPIGSAAEVEPGIFEFTDPSATAAEKRFYQLRSP